MTLKDFTNIPYPDIFFNIKIPSYAFVPDRARLAPILIGAILPPVRLILTPTDKNRIGIKGESFMEANFYGQQIGHTKKGLPILYDSNLKEFRIELDYTYTRDPDPEEIEEIKKLKEYG